MFKAHEQEFRCSKCFQRKIWEQASDWLNSFGDGGESTLFSVSSPPSPKEFN